MMEAKQDLLAALGAAIGQVSPGATLPAAFETPKQAALGDFACTAAMQLAKPLKRNPREVAGALIEALMRDARAARWIDAAEIAGPGFINLKLKAAAKQAVVREVLAGGADHGRQAAHGRKVMVEFVSANPTGPLHTGHTRQACLGDAICNLLGSQGWDVTREFYYNDAGAQIDNLALSVQARVRQLDGRDAPIPEGGYHGEYIKEIAARYVETYPSDQFGEDLDRIRQWHEQATIEDARMGGTAR